MALVKIPNKLILAVNQVGATAGANLVVPGTTQVDGAVISKYIRIHLHDIDLYASGAGTVSLLLGNKEVFSRVMSAAGEVQAYDQDIYNPQDGGDQQSLRLTVVGAINVTGTIRWSYEFAGGNRVKTMDSYFG